uniref:Uncharacterized protein n=1 Tax=Trichogramma kaykai TaxID=54128 RepID=A0ABD2WZT9_9HYME
MECCERPGEARGKSLQLRRRFSPVLHVVGKATDEALQPGQLLVLVARGELLQRGGTGASLAIKGASTILLVMSAAEGGRTTIAGDDGREERSHVDIGVFSSGSLLLESA